MGCGTTYYCKTCKKSYEIPYGCYGNVSEKVKFMDMVHKDHKTGYFIDDTDTGSVGDDLTFLSSYGQEYNKKNRVIGYYKFEFIDLSDGLGEYLAENNIKQCVSCGVDRNDTVCKSCAEFSNWKDCRTD
jgi:hypothetical protein